VRITSYTYPWDLAYMGVETALQRMADDGIDGVDLAATYHPIDSLSPRAGVRMFSDARGAVYFPARAERYGRIRPHLHSKELCAIWPEAAAHAEKAGLALNAWTITLFQPWIRDAHIDCARRLPSGDPSGSGVCAANEDVREYIAALCDDVVDQFGIDIVRLEGVIAHMFDLDWLRPRALVTLSPLARTLLNLCFCDTCTANARTAGLDPERLRSLVNEAINAEIADGPSDRSAERTAGLAADPELRAYVTHYVQSSIDLTRIVRDRLGGRARISGNAATPYGALLGSEAEDGLLAQFVDVADQIAMHPANPHGNRRVAEINARAHAPRELSMLFARVQVNSASTHGQGNAEEQMASDLDEAATRGADEITLYNYALLRDGDVADFVGAVRKAFPAG
jgi:hypothetical protein